MDVLITHYRENYDALVKRISNKLKSKEDAEDIVQEAYARAAQYILTCETDFDRWFSVILLNCQRAFVNDKRSQGIVRSVDETTDEEQLVENEMEYTYLAHKVLDDILKDKSDLMRQVINLHIKFGYKYQDISYLVDCSPNTVKVYLSNFYKELKEIYA